MNNDNRSGRLSGLKRLLGAGALLCAATVAGGDVPRAAAAAPVVVTPADASWADARRWSPLPMSRWKAGDPLDCHLCPQRLFVVVCAEKTLGHIRNLREFARLDEEFRADPKGWTKEMAGHFPCIGDREFRLRASSGERIATGEDELPTSVSYQVMEERAEGQLVEVRYWQGVDIVDAFFKYRFEEGKVVPLESWVVTRGHVAILIVNLMLLSVLAFVAWIGRKLWRWWKARGGGTGKPEGG